MHRAIFAGTIAVSLALVPLYGAGQPPTPAEKADRRVAGHPAGGDQGFMVKAAQANVAEVELGKLAGEKAANDEVKKFGQRMVADHSKANDELKTLAQSKNVTLPTDMDAKHHAEHQKLSKLSGAAFDRAYMQAMVAGHRQVANEFRTESTSGKDPDVKAWAAKTLPTIEEHLKLAQDTSRSIGVVGTSGTLRSKQKK